VACGLSTLGHDPSSNPKPVHSFSRQWYFFKVPCEGKPSVCFLLLKSQTRNDVRSAMSGQLLSACPVQVGHLQSNIGDLVVSIIRLKLLSDRGVLKLRDLFLFFRQMIFDWTFGLKMKKAHCTDLQCECLVCCRFFSGVPSWTSMGMMDRAGPPIRRVTTYVSLRAFIG